MPVILSRECTYVYAVDWHKQFGLKWLDSYSDRVTCILVNFSFIAGL